MRCSVEPKPRVAGGNRRQAKASLCPREYPHWGGQARCLTNYCPRAWATPTPAPNGYNWPSAVPIAALWLLCRRSTVPRSFPSSASGCSTSCESWGTWSRASMRQWPPATIRWSTMSPSWPVGSPLRCSHALPLDSAWERTQNGLRISYPLNTSVHAKVDYGLFSESKNIHAPSASSVSETVRIGPMWFAGFNL